MIFRLHRRQEIAAPIDAVWEFFATPHNLNSLTPPDLNFRIVSDVPAAMYQGQLIEYRVQFIKGIWVRWLTEIRHIEECRYFVDEQRVGPYRLWYHEHIFRESAGCVVMEDRVTYMVGFGPFGATLNTLWIGRKLNQIFDYRARRIEEIFATAP
ncbi:MAG TPA: SRPBCC family protein [Abditibacteriaceae bacterium]|jgi:ligand-binding SRPBCC domain-containing protein